MKKEKKENENYYSLNGCKEMNVSQSNSIYFKNSILSFCCCC